MNERLAEISFANFEIILTYIEMTTLNWIP